MLYECYQVDTDITSCTISNPVEECKSLLMVHLEGFVHGDDSLQQDWGWEMPSIGYIIVEFDTEWQSSVPAWWYSMWVTLWLSYSQKIALSNNQGYHCVLFSSP